MKTLLRLAQMAHVPLLGVVLLIGGSIDAVQAGIVSNVQATKHNLSAAPNSVGMALRTVKAVSESQVCVFCHTPHAADQSVSAPLWNRALSEATYVPYTSASMDATATQPTGNSKLCLSCHDGTLAIGTVGVLNFQNPATIAMSGTAGGVMPGGAGATTGFTRNIGINLSNDHPISFPYDAALGGVNGSDGELRSPPVVVNGETVVGNRTIATKPTFPLQSDELQCTTCHDPHLQDTNTANSALKFLRGNRLQQTQPVGGLFVPDSDIMCLACHEKAGSTWAKSAHAHELVADEVYLDSAAVTREFASGTPVWKASCLNCHDTHSVEGSRRLQREGTSAVDIPKSGGSSAGEQTCYQCHSVATVLEAITPITSATNQTPNIKNDFELAFRMPLTLQPEVHDIGGNFDDTSRGGPRCNAAGDRCGKDFVESQALLGNTDAGGYLTNRHAECTDCHNPHRATKNRLFNDDATTPNSAGTHRHNILAADITPHNNLASGSLRGTFGVEPIYTATAFGANPQSFNVKRGDSGVDISTLVTSTYVTREYQVCLKCHSNYAFNNISPPLLPFSALTGTTQSGTNGVVSYSDVAMEFQSPASHMGEPSTSDSGASNAFSTNNHRSWHPVVAETGRTAVVRPNAAANLWRAPWNGSDVDGGAAIIADAVGTQTMHCSDCHGSTTNMVDGVVPVGGDVDGTWGPHGSNEAFILKGTWNTDAPVAGSNNLCFRCHEESQYADANPNAIALPSAFSDTASALPNLHQRHAYLTTQGGTAAAPFWPAPGSGNDAYRCTMCHTGTAHGWKNKAFLANLNDLGPEVTAIGGERSGGVPLALGDAVSAGTEATTLVASTFPVGYSNGPYYRGTLLSIPTATGFPSSGSWTKASCTGCH